VGVVAAPVLQGEFSVEGRCVDRIVSLEGVRARVGSSADVSSSMANSKFSSLPTAIVRLRRRSSSIAALCVGR
jgi:hypothetical protein